MGSPREALLSESATALIVKSKKNYSFRIFLPKNAARAWGWRSYAALLKTIMAAFAWRRTVLPARSL